MKLYILGISGTFMSGLAILAKEAGFEVTGCDAQCYSPVKELLQQKNIPWHEGYEVNNAFLEADCVIVGNAMKRGVPIVEAMLAQKKPYISGPQWLFEQVLCKRRVIAIAGTHGKTTTTSMLAHILDQAGLQPGFLIGGVAPNFQTNARLGAGEWFVIEADEYDSAFFDKRPKFMHYHHEIAVLHNLEFDHADIYTHLEAIEQQFPYYFRPVPTNGVVLMPRADEALNRVIQQGLYSPLETMSVGDSADWSAQPLTEGFMIARQHQPLATVNWKLLGHFNRANGLSAFAASQRAGVTPDQAAHALSTFIPVKRRLELKGEVRGISVYDDFAHHPTAIQKTLEALKASQRHPRIWAVLEFASYTMKTGVHADKMLQALSSADEVLVLSPQAFELKICNAPSWRVYPTTQQMIEAIMVGAKAGDAVLVMSNRGFENIHMRLLQALQPQAPVTP